MGLVSGHRYLVGAVLRSAAMRWLCPPSQSERSPADPVRSPGSCRDREKNWVVLAPPGLCLWLFAVVVALCCLPQLASASSVGDVRIGLVEVPRPIH